MLMATEVQANDRLNMFALAIVVLALVDIKVEAASRSFTSGGTSLGTQSFSGVTNNGVSIAVYQINGKTEIRINDNPINLNDANVLEENDQYTLLEPAGVPGARIMINKINGQITVDYGGAHYQTLTEEMANARIAEMMKNMREHFNRLHENLSKMFKGWMI